ncbi:MAG: hypothetical protein WD016_00200 [Balneolaceae bacterium]
MRKLLALFFFSVMIFLPNITLFAQTNINSGEDVIRAMHEKYEGKWYEFLTFEQKTTFFGPDGEVQKTQTWFEAMEVPGRLAIKFDEKDGGNGILFRDGVQYGFANGEKIQEAERVHDLLVLGFDVYAQEPEITIEQLTKTGYDLEKWYEDEWQGRAVYVVGSDKPGMDSRQFWIDKERLIFVRNISFGRQNSLQEVQFNKYEPLGEGWIAPEVVFFANGSKGLLEEYSRIKIPDFLSDEIFQPESFLNAVW